ncbi:MAG: nuclear transport factor 2 family protein [Solirubrobacterales bacterium]
MSSEEVEIVRRGYELLSAGDLEGIAPLIHDDFELRPPIAGTTIGAVYRGADGLRQYVADLQEAWASFSQEPEELIDLGDRGVLAILRLDAIGRSSGLELSNRVALHWKFEGGKARAGIGYPDADAARRELGVEG